MAAGPTAASLLQRATRPSIVTVNLIAPNQKDAKADAAKGDAEKAQGAIVLGQQQHVAQPWQQEGRRGSSSSQPSFRYNSSNVQPIDESAPADGVVSIPTQKLSLEQQHNILTISELNGIGNANSPNSRGSDCASPDLNALMVPRSNHSATNLATPFSFERGDSQQELEVPRRSFEGEGPPGNATLRSSAAIPPTPTMMQPRAAPLLGNRVQNGMLPLMISNPLAGGGRGSASGLPPQEDDEVGGVCDLGGGSDV